MRLPRPFHQLPLLFDVERLQAEVAALPPEAWAPHPDRVPGNSAARLISAGGGEVDSVHGQMLPTPWLEAMPYLRQALAGFGVVWSRSRLMRLAPGAGVPEHADINYHWHARVRVHIPIATWPEVRECHMLAGEMDFLLRIAAEDWDAYQRFLTTRLTAAPNVRAVKSALAIRSAKHLPGVPIELLDAAEPVSE